jgi:hypothetical protein
MGATIKRIDCAIEHAPAAEAADHQGDSAAIDWLRQVADDRRLSPAACRLAIVLGSQAAHGFVSASHRELAAQTRCTLRGIGKQMASLVAAGHIHVNRGRGRGSRNGYRLIKTNG